jgi:hypothetical protein
MSRETVAEENVAVVLAASAMGHGKRSTGRHPRSRVLLKLASEGVAPLHFRACLLGVCLSAVNPHQR